MLNFGNKEFRNLQEQVLKNANDIEKLHELAGGVIGVEGPKGDTGDTGPAGAKGERGSVWTVGTNFPLNAKEGDCHLKDSYVFQYTNSQWVPYGSIKGTQGTQGIRGLTGPQGEIGPVGPQGPQGLAAPFYTVVGQLDSIEQLPAPSTAGNNAYLINSNLYGVVGDEWHNFGAATIDHQVNSANVIFTNGNNLNQELNLYIKAVAEANKVYGTSAIGTPQNYTITDSAVAYSIARRDTTGSIKFKDLDLTGTLLQKDKTTFVFENPNSDRDGQTITVDAAGEYSVSLGGSARAEGKRSVAEGTSTIAQGAYSHAEGNKTITTASNAHAEGLQTVASGIAAHSEGELTIASGQASHAEGRDTQATAVGAHAEGVDTIAGASYSHAGGYASEAQGAGSFAHGRSTSATHAYQIALGQRNEDKDNTVLEVGWSETDSVKKNVFEVYKDGHAEIAAIGTTTNSVATKGYVDNSAAKIYKHTLLCFNYGDQPITIISTRQAPYTLADLESGISNVINMYAISGPFTDGAIFFTIYHIEGSIYGEQIVGTPLHAPVRSDGQPITDIVVEL